MLTITCISCQKSDPIELSETIYVKNDGAEMPVYIRGNGASNTFLVILHGGPGGNGLEYHLGTYAEQLESSYALAYWDQRGQGMAQGHFSSESLNMDQMTDDLRAVIFVLKERYGQDIRVFLLGHSWGGTLGTAFLLNDSNEAMVNGWIESDGAHDIPKLNIESVKLFQQVADEQISLGNSVDSWKSFLEWANGIDTNSITLDQGGEINTKAYEAEQLLLDDGILEDPDPSFPPLIGPTNQLTSYLMGNFTSATLEEEIENTSLTSQLNGIKVPCLFLWGKYDFVVPPQLGIDALNQVNTTDKELIIFQYSGHSPMDNEPDLFVSSIRDFVDRN